MEIPMSMTNEQIALRLKWADELESGRYGQTQYHLKIRMNSILEKVPTYAYCCLGVAIEVLGDDTWRGRSDVNLTERACQLLGLDEPSTLSQNDLIAMNDDHSASFKQIAQAIRKHTPALKETK